MTRIDETRTTTRADDEFDRLLRNYRSLDPEQRERLARQVVERARAYRAATIRGLVRWFADWMRRRAAVARLQSFDDRMLKDIGIHRSEIEAVVHGAKASSEEPSKSPAPAAQGAAAAVTTFHQRCPSRASATRHDCVGRAA
jgi:uncharacterized protein YjiS (DUF1127 family)